MTRLFAISHALPLLTAFLACASCRQSGPGVPAVPGADSPPATARSETLTANENRLEPESVLSDAAAGDGAADKAALTADKSTAKASPDAKVEERLQRLIEKYRRGGDPNRVEALAALGDKAFTRPAFSERAARLVWLGLNDSSSQVQSLAVQIAGNYRKHAGLLLPVLRERVGDSAVGPVAIEAIGRLGKDGVGALPQILRALTDKRRPGPTRRRAVEALGELDQRTPQVVMALRAALADSQPGIKLAARKAVSKLQLKDDMK